MWKNPNSDKEISWLTYIIYKKKYIHHAYLLQSVFS